jgi:hypothetical protein
MSKRLDSLINTILYYLHALQVVNSQGRRTSCRGTRCRRTRSTAEPAQPAFIFKPTAEEVVAEAPTAEPAAPEPTVEEEAAGFSFRDDFDMDNDNY